MQVVMLIFQEISRFQWLINIDPIIKNIHSYTNRTSPNQKELINRGNELTSEDSRNFASRHESIENSCKVNLNQLGKALAEGYKWSQTSPPIKKHVIDLEEILTIGLSIEEKVCIPIILFKVEQTIKHNFRKNYFFIVAWKVFIVQIKSFHKINI